MGGVPDKLPLSSQLMMLAPLVMVISDCQLTGSSLG
jgi:hypothetical protein